MSERLRPDVTGLASLRGGALVAALESLDVHLLSAGAVSLNDLLGVVDPAGLREDEFRRLLSVLSRFLEQVPQPELRRIDTGVWVRLIGTVSREQLHDALSVPALRAYVLDEIFRRMEAHVRSDRVKKLDTVVRWRLTGGAGPGGYDRYETVLGDGTCTVRRQLGSRPRVTITVSPADFIRLIIRQATPSVLFVTGKIQVKGDLAFAAGLIGYFDVPTS